MGVSLGKSLGNCRSQSLGRCKKRCKSMRYNIGVRSRDLGLGPDARKGVPVRVRPHAPRDRCTFGYKTKKLAQTSTW